MVRNWGRVAFILGLIVWLAGMGYHRSSRQRAKCRSSRERAFDKIVWLDGGLSRR